MRKLYNHNKGKIHPSPPSSATDHLSLLPVAIAALAAALAPEDKEVLAYLLSCSGTTITNSNTNTKTIKNDKKNFSGGGGGGGGGSSAGDHPPQFNCYCFRCYTSYWVRWDTSPNRQLIHEIIDAYEDGLINKKTGKNRKEKRKNKVSYSSPHAPPAAVEASYAPPPVEERTGDDDQDEFYMGSSEKGPVTKFVSFIGERIWGVWGI